MEADKNKKTTFDGGVTEADIAKWKAKHRKVTRIDAVDGDELHIGYFKRPSLETLKAATKVAQSDEVKGGEIIFDGCWLGGSEHIREDSVLFMSVSKQLAGMIVSAKSSLKNL